MKKSLSLVFAVLLCNSLMAQTYSNLAKTKQGLKTDYAKKVWNEQMAGNEPTFLHHQIPDVPTNKIVEKVLKSKDTNCVIPQLVHIQPNSDSYLLLLQKDKYKDGCWDNNITEKLVFFKYSNGDISILDELNETKYLYFTTHLEILYSPIAIGKEKMGFSLISTLSEGLAGGGRNRTCLHLVEIVDDKMVPLSSILHGSYENYAGNWNEDGTREHDITEKSCVVFADKKTSSDGYFNFIQKCSSTDGKSKKIWKYDATSRMYLDNKHKYDVVEFYEGQISEY